MGSVLVVHVVVVRVGVCVNRGSMSVEARGEESAVHVEEEEEAGAW
jgi:hypothetical protein